MSPPVSPTSSSPPLLPTFLSGAKNQKTNSASRKNSVITGTFPNQKAITEPVDNDKKETISLPRSPVPANPQLDTDDGVGIGSWLHVAPIARLDTIETSATPGKAQDELDQNDEKDELKKEAQIRAQEIQKKMRTTSALFAPARKVSSIPSTLPCVIAKESFLTRYVKNPLIIVGQVLFIKPFGSIGLGGAFAAGGALAAFYSIPGFGQAALIATVVVGLLLAIGSIYKHFKMSTINKINKTFLELLKSNGINIPKSKQEFSSYIKTKVYENSFLTQEQKYPLMFHAYGIFRYPEALMEHNGNSVIPPYSKWLSECLKLDAEQVDRICLEGMPSDIVNNAKKTSFKYEDKEYLLNPIQNDINTNFRDNFRKNYTENVNNYGSIINKDKYTLGVKIDNLITNFIYPLNRKNANFLVKNVNDTDKIKGFKDKFILLRNEFFKKIEKNSEELVKQGKLKSVINNISDFESGLLELDYSEEVKNKLNELRVESTCIKIILNAMENSSEDIEEEDMYRDACSQYEYLKLFPDTDPSEVKIFEQYNIARLNLISDNLEAAKEIINAQYSYLDLTAYSAEMINNQYITGGRAFATKPIELMKELFYGDDTTDLNRIDETSIALLRLKLNDLEKKLIKSNL